MGRTTRTPTVTRRRLTADEFGRMVEAGILHEDDHVELLDGELMQMAAQGGAHVACVTRLNNRITPKVAGRALVSVQSSIRLSPYSEPEPDVALLRYHEDEYGTSLPGPDNVLLIIEVADSSLYYDRNLKLPLYAAAGIPEVWIVDLQRHRVTVYRGPTPNGYEQAIPHTRGATLSPLAFPDLQLAWEDIFGRA
jgi:Uma2 family endonuclease